MEIPSNLRYTKSHEWARRDGADAVVGITAHAQQELRDIVFIELPKVGRAVKAGEAVAVIESVKAAFDIYAPVTGTVAKVNGAVVATPQLVNQDCYGAGWLFAITPGKPADLDALMGADTYSKLLEAGAH